MNKKNNANIQTKCIKLPISITLDPLFESTHPRCNKLSVLYPITFRTHNTISLIINSFHYILGKRPSTPNSFSACKAFIVVLGNVLAMATHIP